MEGNNNQQNRHSWYKPPEYGKRSIGDTSLNPPSIKHKIIKRDCNSDDMRRGSYGSTKSDSKGSITSSKSLTPSIEIPYYAPRKTRDTSKHKISSMPLVNYKISSYVEDSQLESAGSSKSFGLSRKSSIKRSVEIILKASRNSESSKTPSSKGKVDSARHHPKPLVTTTKTGHHKKTDLQSESVKIKSASKNSFKSNKQRS